VSWRVPLVDLQAERAVLGDAIDAAVARVLRSGRYVLGPEVLRFEAELARCVGAAEAVGVGSGTEALWLALRALDVGPGDEVIVPALTFFATVEAVLAVGATPVFVDVEPGGCHMDPGCVERAITSRTRVLLPVHLFGRCADVRALSVLAERSGLVILEDAAQALGAARAGQRAGAWGRAGCFSFHPSKPLGAAGDAGAVTTSDPELVERLRRLRVHGQLDGLHVDVGTTSRIDEIQAAVLHVKLPYLKAWTEARARNARVYAEELGGCAGVQLPPAPQDESFSWSQFAIRCGNPKPVERALEAAGIEWRRYYRRPVAAEPAVGAGQRSADAFPEAVRACRQTLCIPVRGSCGNSTVREIAAVIRGALD